MQQPRLKLLTLGIRKDETNLSEEATQCRTQSETKSKQQERVWTTTWHTSVKAKRSETKTKTKFKTQVRRGWKHTSLGQGWRWRRRRWRTEQSNFRWNGRRHEKSKRWWPKKLQPPRRSNRSEGATAAKEQPWWRITAPQMRRRLVYEVCVIMESRGGGRRLEGLCQWSFAGREVE